MIHIEKLYTTKYANILPGIVDLFKNPDPVGEIGLFNKYVYQSFSELMQERLLAQGFSLGTTFGMHGIEVSGLLDSDFDDPDTYFEISAIEYQGLSRKTHFLLNKRFKLIVHDYMEGGYHFYRKLPNHVLTASGSFGYTPISFPVFFLNSFASAECTDNLYSSTTVLDKKLALVPARKPRPNRLSLLHELDQRNMLNQCDWSLIINFDEPGETGDFTKCKYLSIDGRWAGVDKHPFVQKYRSELPKIIDHADSWQDLVHLNKDLYNKYKWYVSMEPCEQDGIADRDHLLFSTEKTPKGFMSGCAVVTVASAGFNTHLESLGFQLQGDYDHLEGTERINACVDLIETVEPDQDMIQHNYELVTNKNFLCDLLVNELVRVLL